MSSEVDQFVDVLQEHRSDVSNWLGIAPREPGLRDHKVSQIACSSARGADDSLQNAGGIPQNSAILRRRIERQFRPASAV